MSEFFLKRKTKMCASVKSLRDPPFHSSSSRIKLLQPSKLTSSTITNIYSTWYLNLDLNLYSGSSPCRPAAPRPYKRSLCAP